MPEYFSEDFLCDIELLSVYNFMAKGFLKELVLPFLQDDKRNWKKKKKKKTGVIEKKKKKKKRARLHPNHPPPLLPL